jgi:hypothetical protein
MLENLFVLGDPPPSLQDRKGGWRCGAPFCWQARSSNAHIVAEGNLDKYDYTRCPPLISPSNSLRGVSHVIVRLQATCALGWIEGIKLIPQG